MAQRLPTPPTPGSEDARQLTHWRELLYRQFELVGTVTATPGLIAAGATGTVTITVTGCKANSGQTVTIGAPSTIDAGLLWRGFISAANSVTVRIYNSTGGGITPASGEWSARVFL